MLLVPVSCVVLVGELDWRIFGENILVMPLCPHFSLQFSGSDLMPPSGALCEVCNVLDFKCYIIIISKQSCGGLVCSDSFVLNLKIRHDYVVMKSHCLSVKRGAKRSVQGIKGCLCLSVYVVGSLRRYQMAETVDWMVTIRRCVLFCFFSYITVFGEILQSFMCSSTYFTADIHHSVGYILCLTLRDC